MIVAILFVLDSFPTNDISRHVNDIAETIPDTEFDEFRYHRGLI
ncbi:hypothetical protein ACX3UI_02890 [Staphylococcus epidermidis]